MGVVEVLRQHVKSGLVAKKVFHAAKKSKTV